MPPLSKLQQKSVSLSRVSRGIFDISRTEFVAYALLFFFFFVVFWLSSPFLPKVGMVSKRAGERAGAAPPFTTRHT